MYFPLGTPYTSHQAGHEKPYVVRYYDDLTPSHGFSICLNSPSSSVPFSSSQPCAQLANGATTDYRCFVATTTGYFAVEDAAGQLSVYPASQPQVIPVSQAIAIWSCAGFSDPRPTGDLTALDCHDLGLTLLDVRGLASLKTLDCSRNALTELDLTGLAALENLYCDQNPFVGLDLRPCHSLTFVGYASRLFGNSESPIPRLGSFVCKDGPGLFFHASRAAGLFNTDNDTRCAEKYISPRMRPLTPPEIEIRSIAYALKEANSDAIATAAPAMAALIDGPCWLVPIPASDCNPNANLALARAIAALVPGARIKLAIERSQPVESSTARRRNHQFGLEPHEHHFVRTGGPLSPLPLFFVDNVITTGNTIRAARAVLGWGTGLAYADASSPFNTRLRQSARPTPAVALLH